MDRYRVIVLREGTTEDETLFEIAGGAVLIARIVPGALLDVLSSDPVAQGEPDVPAVNPAGHFRPLADRVFDSATAAGAAAEQQDGEAPKRTRRTKAQIAADKEAQGLGFRDAAHRAEVESQQSNGTPGVTVTTTFEGAAPVPPAEVPSDYVPPASPAAAPSSDAPPWNPFTQ